MVLAAYLAGHDIIRECMEDEAIRGYLEGTLFQEIIPTRSLPREDCEAFARAVEERKQQNRRAENTAGGLGPGAHGVSGVVSPSRTNWMPGRVLLRLLIDHAAKDVRCSIPASELVIGLKCGGSDGLSGTRKTDAKGSTKAIYIDGEFGGFAIHLVRR